MSYSHVRKEVKYLPVNPEYLTPPSEGSTVFSSIVNMEEQILNELQLKIRKEDGSISSYKIKKSIAECSNCGQKSVSKTDVEITMKKAEPRKIAQNEVIDVSPPPRPVIVNSHEPRVSSHSYTRYNLVINDMVYNILILIVIVLGLMSVTAIITHNIS